MKKLLPFCCAFFLSGYSNYAQAQGIRFGVKAGLNYSTLFSPLRPSPARRVGPAVGVFSQIPIGQDDFFSLQPEVLYSVKGADANRIYGFKQRYDYLDVPLLAKINAGGFIFEAGPQVSFLLDNRIESTSGGTSRVINLNRVVAGAVAGVGYQLPMGLSLTLRYAQDLSTISNGGERNTLFQLQLGYLFRRK